MENRIDPRAEISTVFNIRKNKMRKILWREE